MARAALIRFLVAVVFVAPVVRMTCDVTCIQPATPPSCHSPASQTDTPDDRCSHDHTGNVARLVDAAPVVAVVPAVVIVSLRAAVIDLVVSPAPAFAGRGSPLSVLRV
jgi:hypothetical protein